MWKKVRDKLGNHEQPDYGLKANDPNSYRQQGGLDWDHQATYAPPQRPQRKDNERLPEIPYEDEAVIHTAQQGHRRQASSVYSQTSHVPQRQQSTRHPGYAQASSGFQNQVNTYNDDHIEISPPSSPDIGPSDRLPQDAPSMNYNSRPAAPQKQTRTQQSHLPVPRKKTVIERRPVSRNVSGAEADAAASLGAMNEDGRPTTVWPSSRNTPIVTNLEQTFGAPYAKQPKESLGDRMRKMRGVKHEKAAPPPTQQRPEWKGGSGRMAIVPPPEDNLSAPPLAIPRKSSKRVPSVPSMNNSRSNTPNAGTPVGEAPLRGNAAGGGYFPPRTTSTARDRSPAPPKSAVHDPSYENRFQNQSLDTHPAQRNRSVTGPGVKPPAVALTVTPTGDVRPTSANPPTYPTQYGNEVSRFSMTTYAPSNASGSPRASLDAPPVPEIPQESVLNRRRPVGTSYTKPTKSDRPPPVTGTPKLVAMHERTPSLSKALPPSPEAIAASDRVTALEAQLADLEQQHRNILASIKQMTRLNPETMTGLTPGLGEEARRLEMLRREEEKKKVASLREELERVKGMEHEVGLRAHRARKKRDERCEWESTGLWVRRVTG